MEVRLEYSVGKEVRYLSHLDFLRLFIRALRRAGLPVAYSRGFNPHPKLAFGPPLAVGITSTCEYVDIELAEPVPVAGIIERLGQALPKGVTIKQGKEIKGKTAPLMAVIERARFQVKVPLLEGRDQMDLEQAIENLMNRSGIVVMRNTKEGPRPKDIRQGIFRLAGKEENSSAVLQMELQVGSQGSVRPDEVVRGLIELEGIPLQQEEMEIQRTGLFLFKNNGLVTPLEIL
ncbi:MAG: DUF2344 domain-containing protein [Clostridia bacterium]|jgi:radical SAM-linked protein|nr:DUF2344 domain-containing protein [Clostridia bacterium]